MRPSIMNVEKRGALTTHQENFFDNIKKKGGGPEVSQGLRLFAFFIAWKVRNLFWQLVIVFLFRSELNLETLEQETAGRF